MKILLYFFFLSVILILGLILPRITPHQNLHYALIDKHNQLSEIDTPRILLVGGSNLSFGIDSQELEQELNKNVINTSIHAGMGLKYIVEDILPYVRERDIVILAAEYDHFFGDVVWGYEPMISSIFAIPSNLHLLNFNNWKQMVSAVPKEALKNIFKFFVVTYRAGVGKDVVGVYDRDSFDAYGDVVVHHGRSPESFVSSDIDPDYNPVAIEIIKKLKNYVEKRNGILLVTFPALNKTSCELYPQKIQKVYDEFIMNKFSVLGSPGRYCFPDSLFYNAKYHLTKQGIDTRTSLLIEDFKSSANGK